MRGYSTGDCEVPVFCGGMPHSAAEISFWRNVLIHLVRIEVIIVVLLKMQSWDITLCHWG